jgi:thymidylate kinase
LLKDLGIEREIRLHTDAAAALGIIGRKGVGKVRHLDTSVLWLQQKELQQAVQFLKVPGADNTSDLMTKHLAENLVVKPISPVWEQNLFMDARTQLRRSTTERAAEGECWILRLPAAHSANVESLW